MQMLQARLAFHRRLPQVPEYSIVRAARFFQRIGQHGEPERVDGGGWDAACAVARMALMRVM